MILKAEPFVTGEILRLKEKVRGFKYKVPTLAIISIGDDPASQVYIRNKTKMCEAIGIECGVYKISPDIPEDKIIQFINEWVNQNNRINGCIVQLPLPGHLNTRRILDSIDPRKDVDGLTSQQIGWLHTENPFKLEPCTPRGIVDLLKYYNVPLKGKDVVIVNHSEIVGRPLAELMLQEDATPMICHINTKTLTLREMILQADIVVTAIGKAEYFNWTWFRMGSTIVDVSMNRDYHNKLCGDVSKGSYDELLKMGCNITPVPGGIGRTTVLSLMKNVIKAYENQNE